jgi:hypothetical protein
VSNTELEVSLFPLQYAIARIFFSVRVCFRLFWFWGEKVAVGAIDLAKAPKKCPLAGQKTKNRRRTKEPYIARKTPYKIAPQKIAGDHFSGPKWAVFGRLFGLRDHSGQGCRGSNPVVKGLWALGNSSASRYWPKAITDARYKNDVLHKIFFLGVGDTIRTAKLMIGESSCFHSLSLPYVLSSYEGRF